jgi:hypothetical protein
MGIAAMPSGCNSHSFSHSFSDSCSHSFSHSSKGWSALACATVAATSILTP